MLNNIKTSYSLTELESITGIKAATLRMWEKRYALFQPTRSKTNARSYTNDDLRKILNISLLKDNGMKISAIAALSLDELNDRVGQLSQTDNHFQTYFSSAKLAMLEFNEGLFHSTIGLLRPKYAFEKIFEEIMIPLLDLIGQLWQTDSILPVHEHFISNLIKQEILLESARLRAAPIEDFSNKYVLFLPLEEIHEIGILYLHYLIKKSGAASIYLGPNVPNEDLSSIPHGENTVFISQFTIYPSKADSQTYIEEIHKYIHPKAQLWVTGRTAPQDQKSLKTSTKYFDSLLILSREFQP